MMPLGAFPALAFTRLLKEFHNVCSWGISPREITASVFCREASESQSRGRADEKRKLEQVRNAMFQAPLPHLQKEELLLSAYCLPGAFIAFHPPQASETGTRITPV